MEFRTHYIESFCSEKNVKLVYFASGACGHVFRAVDINDESVQFAVKMIPNCKYSISEIHDPMNFSTVEMRMTHLLTELESNYFVKPIDSFYCSICPFLSMPGFITIKPKKSLNGIDTYKSFIENYSPQLRSSSHSDSDNYYPEEFGTITVGRKYEKVGIIAYPWCEDDLLSYLRVNCQKLTVDDYANIFFQILSALAIIHKKYPAFRHNTFKANNILVNSCHDEQPTEYDLDGKKYVFPTCPIKIKLWDFDFCIY